jgi:hypothetical protein
MAELIFGKIVLLGIEIQIPILAKTENIIVIQIAG